MQRPSLNEQITHHMSIALFILTILLAAMPSSQPLRDGNGFALVHAHAHNDYEHPRPLLDALDCGFLSVEADVFLVNGQLLVAHDREKTSPQRTLQSLYLD